MLAKVSLDAGNVGFGLLVGMSGLGLTVGSIAATPLLDRFGTRLGYACSIGAMGIGFGVAAAAPTIALAMAGVLLGSLGNGVAVVCNALLVQRAAPDELRGRVFTVIMSFNYVVFGVGMVVSGLVVDEFGARWLWGAASIAFLAGAATAAILARGVDAEVDADQAAAELDDPMPSRI